MKITIQGVCEFIWSPTQQQLAVLTKLSEHHYDGVCKAASKPGGFIWVWAQQVEHNEPEFGEVCARGSFRDFDTCLKIMEGADVLCGPDELGLVYHMGRAFRKMLHRANQLYDVWREELS